MNEVGEASFAEQADLRGRMVRLEDVFEKVLAARAYPPPVAEMLGEALCLAALLAATLKYDGIFTLQAQGEGPIRMVVIDVTSDGGMRAHARFDQDAFAGGDRDERSIASLFGGGHLAFTVDQGPETERYQGITELTGASLADCAHTYFRQSEQLQTAIMLAARLDDGGRRGRCAGLMIQRLPDDEEEIYRATDGEENWRKSVILMSSLEAGELLSPALPINQILYRLYHQDGVRVYRPRPLAFSCRCSRDKVARTLTAFPANELADMHTKDGCISATCEFCQANYVFTDADLSTIEPA